VVTRQYVGGVAEAADDRSGDEDLAIALHLQIGEIGVLSWRQKTREEPVKFMLHL
jgi:hypothetical protein